MSAYWLESLSLVLRWLHLVAAIAWIGESFYFVMLDRSLKPAKNPAPGVVGELWSVHGGGFYHKQKYLPAPPSMPEDLHWSKWKSYATWLSGLALFSVLYLTSPSIYLVDPAVAQLSHRDAILLALAFPIVAWLIYHQLCRMVGFRDQLLGALVALLVLALCYVATHLFAGRAAFLLVGAALGTIMSANVFFVIIPGQKRLVAALSRGEQPDPLPGMQGKQRSVHNTYFTLPVVFAMLSNHYATGYAHEYSWLVLAVFMAAGALIRQFFVLWHSGGRAWWLLAAGATLVVGMFAWLAPNPRAPVVAIDNAANAGSSEPAPVNVLMDASPSTQQILPLLAKHCTVCHSKQPSLMPSAPMGLQYDQAAQVESHAERIYQQAVVLKVMPPGNLTKMSAEERAALARWYLARTAK